MQWPRVKTSAFKIKMLCLSTIYVIVCAIRAIWPRKDVDRICFVDHFLSTVFIGRTMATIAEICFVKQLSMLLSATPYKYQSRSSFIALCEYYVPFVLIAEVFSWIGVATKRQIWNGFEESIWTRCHCIQHRV